MGNIVAKYKQQQLKAHRFDMATRCVIEHDMEYSDRNRNELYGLYKLSTVGRCRKPNPDPTYGVAFKQWCAWKCLGKMPVGTARRMFIHKVDKFCTRRICTCAKDSRQPWNRQTWPWSYMIMRPPQTIFDLVRDKNSLGVRMTWHESHAQVHDVHGMTLMHWAADRNAVDIIKFLMQNGCCVNELDPDQQTPMHYAVINGHLQAVRALLHYHPRLDLRDNEGNSCFDLTNDKAILRTLQAEQKRRDSKPPIYY